MESHQRDHENFLVVSRNRRRRAKALLDFERHDDDELGFRKNDIITVSHDLLHTEMHPNKTMLPVVSNHVHTLYTPPFLWFLSHWIFIFLFQIISQKDEHCWVGELNGLRGVSFSYASTPTVAIWIIDSCIICLAAHLTSVFCGFV